MDSQSDITNKDSVQEHAPRNDEGLTLKQERAIVALLHEPTITKAAAAAEVCERVIYKWLRQIDFSNAYRRARREAFSQAIALTQHYAPLAVNTLAKIMADEKARPILA